MDGLIALVLAKGYTDEQIATLGKVINFKGVKDTYAELPTSGNQVGDVWQVREKSAEYIWTPDLKWEMFGSVTSTNKHFPSDWTINDTRLTLCQQIQADSTALVGDVYIGGVRFTDLPAGLGNGEAAISIFDSTAYSGKVIHIDLYSSTTAPYTWSCNYYKDSSNVEHVTDWQAAIIDVTVDGTSVVSNGIAAIDLSGKQDALTAGTGIDITNNVISIDSNSAITIYDERIDDADKWLTNGYVKTRSETTEPVAEATKNLPSVCTGNDRWGVLFYAAENNANHGGLQQYFPIDGTYKGRVFYRSVTGLNDYTPPIFGEWNLVPWSAEKQDVLTAGENITITNNVIAGTVQQYTVTVDI